MLNRDKVEKRVVELEKDFKECNSQISNFLSKDIPSNVSKSMSSLLNDMNRLIGGSSTDAVLESLKKHSNGLRNKK